MSKLDELKRIGAGNAAESMGAGILGAGPVHGARPSSVPTVPPHLRGVAKSKNIAEIMLDRIGPDPDQPREEFEPAGLDRLAESLRTKGQLQPIRVRWEEGRGQYVIVCGERRWRAAGLAGLATMQCVIMEGPVTPAELLSLQVIENMLREDLRPIEQARSFRQLMDGHGWSVSQLARELAIDHSGISRALALLELPTPVQDHVERGELAPSVAYEVSKLADPAAQADVAALAVAKGLNRAEVVEAVRERGAKGTRSSKSRGAKPKPRKTSATIRTAGGAKVTIEHRRGVDEEVILLALREAMTQVEAHSEAREAGEAA
jgi:ParB family chromosome partitioning protein